MKQLGFIGLGNMGKGMALNLTRAGYPLTVHDIRPEPVQELVKAGAKAVGSPREVAQNSEVVITMVTSSPHVEQVMFGPDGVLAGMKKGNTIIDMSTIDPIVTRKVAATAAEKGIDMLDAPVSGAPPKAADGTLSIMVGGKKEIFEQCKPILEVMGEKIIHAGHVGMGEVVKLANNLAAAINGVGVFEAFLFGVKLGADPKVLYEVMSASSGNSWVLQTRVPYPDVIPQSPANEDFAPGFTTDLMAKDLGLILSAAGATKTPLLAGSLTRQLIEAAQAAGYGSKDWSVVAKVIQQLAGEEA
ncbi:MAG TPA: 3-hydroxyisobutyrate dehydrogenase [Dehalococcoidales bacterium]|nr:3-hydroxyisobutyrate dehydrogenase [Dehalococcoidales bacterium]